MALDKLNVTTDKGSSGTYKYLKCMIVVKDYIHKISVSLVILVSIHQYTSDVS